MVTTEIAPTGAITVKYAGDIGWSAVVYLGIALFILAIWVDLYQHGLRDWPFGKLVVVTVIGLPLFIGLGIRNLRQALGLAYTFDPATETVACNGRTIARFRDVDAIRIITDSGRNFEREYTVDLLFRDRNKLRLTRRELDEEAVNILVGNLSVMLKVKVDVMR
jgi:hypothetical protein